MDEINREVAKRLRRLRQQSGLSLEDLATRSGVSRAMLSQVETLKANPTIAILWRIAGGLGVPFSELLGTSASAPAVRLSRSRDARYLYSADKTLRSRPLLSGVPGHRVELYELRLAPGAVEEADPHPPATFEHLVITSGKLRLRLGEELYELASGDALLFTADRAHTYECVGKRPFMGLSLILYGQ